MARSGDEQRLGAGGEGVAIPGVPPQKEGEPGRRAGLGGGTSSFFLAVRDKKGSPPGRDAAKTPGTLWHK